jgi:uncharacterized protein (TIGR03086 family)
MTGTGQTMRPRLLDVAIGYCLAVAQEITPELLPQPTPCRGWDVQMLLRHASESLAALLEGIDAGRIGLAPAPEDMSGDPVQVFRDRAGELLGAWARAAGGTAEESDGTAIIAVADHCITLAVMADAGALELAVHGWDLSWACGHREPIPGALATGLLPVSALLVPRADRHPLFAPPVTVPPEASPSDRLVAYLGRTPR